MPKISIIMPAYNVDKYIEKTISYIQDQTFRDFELIVVDDGSNDNTGWLCDRFAAKDERIHVFHKKNGGVSNARNYGLERMAGQYMTFIDSDDWVTLDYLQYLYQLITVNDNIQIAMIAGEQVKDVDIPVNKEESQREVISVESAVRKMLLRNTYTHANWGKLYKAALWRDIRFPDGVIYDDYDTTYRAFSKAENVICSNAVKYSYVQRCGSLMHAACSDSTLTVLNVADEITDFMIKTWPSSKVYAIDMKIATYMKNMQAILNNGMESFKEEQKRIVNCVRKNASIILLSSEVPINDKIKVIALLISKRLFLKLYNSHDGNVMISE